MRQCVSTSFALAVLGACCALSFAGCGKDEKAAPEKPVLGQEAPKTVALAGGAAQPSASSGGGDCKADAACARKCESECAVERDRAAFYSSKRLAAAGSPFAVQIERVFYSGTCPSGDVPEKRKPTAGLKAIVEGTLTYNGDDVIFAADLGGAAYFRFGPAEFAEVEAASRNTYSGYYYGRSTYSRVLRAVHGSDPWRKGESRPFHWESTPFSEAFCEAAPSEAGAYVELVAFGMRGGRAQLPIAVVPLRPEEILGMALRQQVKIRTQKKDGFDDETADAQFAKLDRMLVTRLTGTTEWLKRTSIVQPRLFDKGPAAGFPVEASSLGWKVTVKSASEVKEFGGYAPKGEDQSLAVLDVTISSQAGEGATLSKLSPRLEVEPGKWQKPVDKALGQLDLSAEVPMGGSASGKLVFPRQRFQRPFRLEVKTPDGTTLYVDVLSYDFGTALGR
jgi:hypothetical protein